MGDSPFYRTMSQKTDAELKAVLEDIEGYLPEAREVAEIILREREVDIILEDKNEPVKDQSAEEYEDHERLFFVNWQAPTIVILIGFGLYFLLGLSFYFNMKDEIVVTINGSVIFRYIVVLIVYFAFAVLIDGIMKGKAWARATYAGLAGLLILFRCTLIILVPNSFIPSLLDIGLMLIEGIFVVLLFLHPASQWFATTKKKKSL